MSRTAPALVKGMLVSVHVASQLLEDESARGGLRVDAQIQRSSADDLLAAMDGKVVAGWATEVGTTDKRGFSVSGSHTFKFKDGKILSLKVVVSPKADETPQFDLNSVGVEDIGRLSLAAWMVV